LIVYGNKDKHFDFFTQDLRHFSFILTKIHRFVSVSHRFILWRGAAAGRLQPHHIKKGRAGKK
jgi:uncharacterized membrane protein